MHFSVSIAAVVFLMPVLRACDPGTPASSTPTEPDVAVIPEVDLACGRVGEDPVTVTSASIDGDRLTLTIEYSGGCGDAHSFDLCWDGSWIKTLPMKVGLDLAHDAGGDACRMLIQEERTFDLAPVADETLGGFPATEGVWVLVDDETVWYEL